MEVIGAFIGGLTADDLLVITCVVVSMFLASGIGRGSNKWPGFIVKSKTVPISETIDRKSGEKVYDKVPLEQAQYISDRFIGSDTKPVPAQVYLLVDCTPEQFAELERTRYPVNIGYFYKDGWTAGLPFYLFKCTKCNETMVDYKHGHEPFLFCKSCEHRSPFYIYRMKTRYAYS